MCPWHAKCRQTPKALNSTFHRLDKEESKGVEYPGRQPISQVEPMSSRKRYRVPLAITNLFNSFIPSVIYILNSTKWNLNHTHWHEQFFFYRAPWTCLCVCSTNHLSVFHVSWVADKFPPWCTIKIFLFYSILSADCCIYCKSRAN